MDNDLQDKSNNEILFEIKQLQADHEALKIKMLNDFDELEKIEKRFAKANEILLKRLKGDIK
jgi:hypothetical protein